MLEKLQKSSRGLILVGLSVAIMAVFGRSLSYGFVNYDDPHYVINNYSLHGGLTVEAVRWAFSTGYAENWHPLTWLSHMADFSLYGMNPQAHRLTNILLHLLSTFALFGVLSKLTGAHGRSAFVAALFAIHPLHVESVVWIAERKDVLSGLFWMTTIGAYTAWTKRKNALWYLLLCLSFALGLLAKSMLVTLPCVLLLLDYWPLGRATNTRDWKDRVVEKLPLFALSLVFSVVTYWVQRAGGTAKTFEALPVGLRIENAIVAYCAYLGKMFYPLQLAVLYPHRSEGFPVWQVAGGLAILVAITAGAWLLRGRAPYLIVGWLWYLGALAPVIGIVQVGDQAMADRYTYLPLVGVFIALVWGAADLQRFFLPTAKLRYAGTMGGIVVLLLGALAWVQVGYWRDSIALFERCIAVTGENPPARVNLGRAYHDAGRSEDAVREYEGALAVLPGLKSANNNLGIIWLEQGDAERAAEAFRNCIGRGSDDGRLYLNLGVALAMMGREDEAREAMKDAVRLAPKFLPARFSLGALMVKRGEWIEAEAHLEAVVAGQPGNVRARMELARAYQGQHRFSEALEQVELALALDPGEEGLSESLRVLREALAASDEGPAP